MGLHTKNLVNLNISSYVSCFISCVRNVKIWHLRENNDAACNCTDKAYTCTDTLYNCTDTAYNCTDTAYTYTDTAYNFTDTEYNCTDTAYISTDTAYNCTATEYDCTATEYICTDKADIFTVLFQSQPCHNARVFLITLTIYFLLIYFPFSFAYSFFFSDSEYSLVSSSGFDVFFFRNPTDLFCKIFLILEKDLSSYGTSSP